MSANGAAVKPKKVLTPIEQAEEDIRKKPIPMAFAMVPVEGQPGMYRDVVLYGVHAERIEFLESSARPSRAVYCLDRVKSELGKRNYKRGLG